MERQGERDRENLRVSYILSIQVSRSFVVLNVDSLASEAEVKYLCLQLAAYRGKSRR